MTSFEPNTLSVKMASNFTSETYSDDDNEYDIQFSVEPYSFEPTLDLPSSNNDEHNSSDTSEDEESEQQHEAANPEEWWVIGSC